MTDEELIAGLEDIRNRLTAVATGGPRIMDVNDEYQRVYATVVAELASRRIENPITYGSLWDWYGRWSSGDLPTYQSRRTYIAELVSPVINRIRTGRAQLPPATGWQRVDRAVDQLRDDLARAQNEEQFQAIGHLSREALISLAQAVYVRERHLSLDGTNIGATDGRRMLEAYIAVELGGGPNEEARRHAKSALELANALQHRRTASFRDAAMCLEATTTVVNVIAILAGRRDPRH